MVAEAIIEPDNHVRKDVLLSTVKLYVRVRTFSMSKDVIQRQKYTAIKTNKVYVLMKRNGQMSQCPQWRTTKAGLMLKQTGFLSNYGKYQANSLHVVLKVYCLLVIH